MRNETDHLNSKTMIDFQNEANTAFDRAVNNRTLSPVDGDNNYAGDFMFMYSKDGDDYFKNIISRDYVKSPR